MTRQVAPFLQFWGQISAVPKERKYVIYILISPLECNFPMHSDILPYACIMSLCDIAHTLSHHAPNAQEHTVVL